jgi:hypothetical protein
VPPGIITSSGRVPVTFHPISPSPSPKVTLSVRTSSP